MDWNRSSVITLTGFDSIIGCLKEIGYFNGPITASSENRNKQFYIKSATIQVTFKNMVKLCKIFCRADYICIYSMFKMPLPKFRKHPIINHKTAFEF